MEFSVGFKVFNFYNRDYCYLYATKNLILFFLISSLLLSIFWFLLVDCDLSSLLVGVIFIPMSIFAASKLSEKTDSENRDLQVNILKVPKFIGFFLYQSIKGGIDTARRVFSVNMHLKAEFLHYPVKHLPAGLPMNLFMNVVSLLPGSVSVIREPNSVLVHVLAVTNSTIDDIYQCEVIISELFGIDIATVNHDSSTEQVG